MAKLAPCAMLWIGERLSAVERACMRSVVAQGHSLTLYVYGRVDGIPSGVELADASDIVPRSAIVVHPSGSLALFSDRFRFELFRRGVTIWLDTDVYLLAPLQLGAGGYLFGWEEPGQIGSAVLALPADSPMIAPVLRLFERPYAPPWLRPIDRARARWRGWREGKIDLGRLPWGVAGPLALTALARSNGLLAHALPREAFYPYDWRAADWVFDPARDLREFVRAGTIAVHLYNFMIASRKGEPAAPGSFMDRLQREGA